MDPGLLKLLDDDEDDNAPAAADVDAFAAVLKGDLGGAAHAAAADCVTGAGNGTLQSLPQSPATSVSTGLTGGKTVSVVPAPMPSGQQQQLIWNQLSPEQQREVFQRRAMQQQQQQRLQQQQIQQQQQQQQNQHPAQQQESGSSSTGSGNRRGMAKEGISFTALMPLLQPHLPPDQGQQLSGLYQRFKRNEITREDFIRGARVIAGDQVLVQTIRQMHMKQQVQLQHQQNQQKLQQQQQVQPQLQPHQQPHLPQQHSSHQQQLAESISAVSPNPTLSEDPIQQQEQQQSQDPTNAVQQTKQPPLQTQEVTGTNGAQQNVPQAHQVSFSANHITVSQATQPQSHLPSSLPQSKLQSSPLKQGDQQQDPGHRQQPSNNTTSPTLSQQVRHEVDDSPVALQSGKQQFLPATFPSKQSRPPISAAFSPQTSMVAGAGQPSQPYTQMGLPQQSLPGQLQVHLQLQQPQPGAQAAGPLTLPVSLPTPPQQPQLEKPLTKYAKQKLRKEQKKREEEERQRKQAEEDSVKKLQTAPSGVVTTAHQGLHPQVPTPQLSLTTVELNKQSYGHHAGPLAQQAQLQSSVTKVDKLAPISPGGLVASERGPSLLSVKQEPSDLQSEQKRQASQIPKFSDLLPGQAVQNPGGQTHPSDTSVLPSSNANHVQVKGPNAEQVQIFTSNGSLALPSSSTVPSSAQLAGMASISAPGTVAIPSLAGTSGVQSTLIVKQMGGLQRMGSIPTAVPGTCAYNSISLHPVTSFSYASAPGIGAGSGQTAATMTTTPNKTTPKKPAVGQKKSFESTPAQQPPSKKQKVSVGEPDQSLDQLNDVTAVSGVNLKEEEEQLLVGPKETSGTTEAMRKIVQEEEERLFLEKEPLRAKLDTIAARCGVKIVSEDIGRCLSMSVEERLRGMLYKLIKFSRQRCDTEKDRHKVVVTSDVRRQILLLKRKAKEILDKKLAEESERLRRLNEKDKGSLPEVERDEIKAKAQKAQQEEDDRLKANAANVAARAAVGADDMLLKWQLMAEQGRQKRQGVETGALEENAANRAGFSGDGVAGINSDKKLQDTDPAAVGPGDAQGPPGASVTGRPPDPGPGASLLRCPLVGKSWRGGRPVTVKDVISLLETEPQMSKSTLLYCLYERHWKMANGENIVLTRSRT